MTRDNLDWNYVSWQKFQKLSIEVAKILNSDCEFSEYLGPGQKQEGIDLQSFRKKNGEFYCIQCKREKNLTVSKFKKILRDFEDGTFFNHSSNFVVITSADLQTNRSVQEFIKATKLNYHHNYGKEFDCWDKVFIEQILKRKPGLVEAYFGVSQAEDFCYPEIKYDRFQKVTPIIPFINRKLTKHFENSFKADYSWNVISEPSYKLFDLVTQDRNSARKICVIGDAYQGKSSLIRQTIFEIQEHLKGIQPIFLEIKEFNVQPIADLITEVYGKWRTIPADDIILFIDGIDEVPTDRFDEMIKYINQFTITYNAISIVFTCRKLFYNKYDVSKTLKDFQTYSLYNLQYDDIQNYIKNTLSTKANDFTIAISLAGLSELLTHPFYLINLVEEFAKPPHKLPESKIKIIDSLINRAFNTNKYRKLYGSESIKDDIYRYNNVIENFAFALQLAGVNSFKSDKISELLNTEEQILLQHNALISQTADTWSFTNALFQEHIAARKISKMSFDLLVKYSTVGTLQKKIKIKWIQTISSLLSILDQDSDQLFHQTFKLIEEDNIELIFQTESSKYDEKLKVSLVQKMFQKCVSLNIRPMIIYEETVGFFIQNSISCKEYLLDLLYKKLLNDRIKIVCCRVLKYSSLEKRQLEKFAKFTVSELSSVSNVDYAASLVTVISFHKYGDKALVEKLTSLAHNQSHIYRDEIYELILTLNLVDEFYSYGIEGLPMLIQHNKPITHSGSERNLEEFLLGTKKGCNINKLITLFKTDDWKLFYKMKNLFERDFFKRVFRRSASLFESYPFIIFPIAAFIEDLGKRFLRDDLKEVDLFLDETKSRWLIVRILINKILGDNNWELGGLIDIDSFDYVLFEFENRNLEIKKLKNCIGALNYKYDSDKAESFKKLAIDLTEGLISDSENELLFHQYQKAEKTKINNDLIYIQSVDSFRTALIKYFKSFGKKNLTIDELVLDLDRRYSTLREFVDSNFLFSFLRQWHDQPSINLKDCLEELNNEDYFDDFRAQEILSYNHRNEENDKILTEILKNYYYKNLQKANFQNCIRVEDGYYTWLHKEVRLVEIFKKFAFETEEKYLREFIWLDSDGIRGFEGAKNNKRQTISQMVIERLSSAGIEQLKKSVVKNIRTGISYTSVLGTHLSLCKHLNIFEAKDLILDCVKSLEIGSLNRADSANIYLALNGDISELLSILISSDEYNDYFFDFLVTKLYKIYPVEAGAKLREALISVRTNEEAKIRYARLLSDIGDHKAFSFLVNQVRIHKRAPYNIQEDLSVAKVDTRKALNEIFDIMYLVIDEKHYTPHRFHDSAKHIILEWLNMFSEKSETDLHLVIEFIEKAKEQLSGLYGNVADFNWYSNRILENFRNSDKSAKSISEIKKILKEIECF